MNVEVLRTMNGVPTTAVVSLSLQPAQYASSGWQFAADLRPFAVAVSPGDVLAIQLRSDTAGGWNFESEYPNDVYARGTSFELVGPSEWLHTRSDFFFRTYVDPAPVPEPSSAVLVGVAACAALWRARRRAGLSNCRNDR